MSAASATSTSTRQAQTDFRDLLKKIHRRSERGPSRTRRAICTRSNAWRRRRRSGRGHDLADAEVEASSFEAMVQVRELQLVEAYKGVANMPV